MISRPASSLAAALASALVAGGACGGDDGPGADGGSELSSLEVDSPGEQIGLPFNGEATLSVKYSDPGGAPVPGAAIGFQLVTSASESTGGSTLSASQAVTDGSGTARVQLVAGAERVNFRVQVTAAQAPPALFYVAVSEEGFADLVATPQHAGFRAADDFGAVEVRLYGPAELRCADLDIDAPPESVFPVRALGGFAGDASYRNLGAGETYTVAAWGSLAAGGPAVAAGCVELAADQVRAGAATRVLLPVADRMPALVASIEIASTFNATPLAAAVSAAGPDVWRALECPLGRAQLLIDCALDALAADGALDCDVTGASPVVTEVQARRGSADAGGCRPPSDRGGSASLDAIVEERLGPPWPQGEALSALLAARRSPLVSFELISRIAPDGSGPLRSVVHRLDRLAVTSGGATAELDLVASDRPLISQTAPVSIDPDGGRLSIGSHSFTVDYGRFAAGAFAELGLEPSGLADRAADLGSALYQSVSVDQQSGCPAFSQVVCADIGRPASCLATACGAAGDELDILLDTWWQVLEGAGRDLALTGSTPVHDDDGDLALDGLGLGSGAAGRGAWSAEMALASGETAAVTGIFSGAVSRRADPP